MEEQEPTEEIRKIEILRNEEGEPIGFRKILPPVEPVEEPGGRWDSEGCYLPRE